MNTFRTDDLSMLYKKGNSKTLGVFRITIFLIWIFNINRTPLELYAFLPVDQFYFWGFYKFMDFIPFLDVGIILNKGFLILFKYMLILLCTLCLFGVRPFLPVAVVACVGILLFDAIVKGYYGFANHAQTALIFSTLIISFFPSADSFSIFGETRKQKNSNHYRLPLLLAVLVLTTAYAFIGTHRMVYAGFDIFLENSIVVYVAVQSLNYAATSFSWGMHAIETVWLTYVLQTGFFITTVFEILSPFVLVSKTFRVTWLMIIVPFHVSTLFFMNIFFWENLLLITVLLVFLTHKRGPLRSLLH